MFLSSDSYADDQDTHANDNYSGPNWHHNVQVQPIRQARYALLKVGIVVLTASESWANTICKTIQVNEIIITFWEWWGCIASPSEDANDSYGNDNNGYSSYHWDNEVDIGQEILDRCLKLARFIIGAAIPRNTPGWSYGTCTKKKNLSQKG